MSHPLTTSCLPASVCSYYELRPCAVIMNYVRVQLELKGEIRSCAVSVNSMLFPNAIIANYVRVQLLLTMSVYSFCELCPCTVIMNTLWKL